jgi:F-type H+-transporting ATPase subunit a
VIATLAAGSGGLDLRQHWSGWLAGLAEKIAHALFAKPSLDDIAFVEASLYAWVFVIPGLAILCLIGTSRMTRVPGRVQNLLEWTVEALEGFCRSMIGAHFHSRFVAFIGGLFIYIFALNLWGIVPGMQAATSTANTTAALAIATFLMVQYTGVRLGGRDYVKHFLGEPIWLAPLNVPIHIIGELARPLSLTLRLMGNIGGEEKAVAIFVSLGLLTGAYIPFQLPLLALTIFTSFLQALVFCLLSCFYIAGALPHVHDHTRGHGHVTPRGHEAEGEDVHLMPA